jgi:hypothetical protein
MRLERRIDKKDVMMGWGWEWLRGEQRVGKGGEGKGIAREETETE